MRYYSIYRPISPGTFPRYKENAVIDIHNFDRRQRVKRINREAWGWVEYESPIPAKDAESYELIEGR